MHFVLMRQSSNCSLLGNIVQQKQTNIFIHKLMKGQTNEERGVLRAALHAKLENFIIRMYNVRVCAFTIYVIVLF